MSLFGSIFGDAKDGPTGVQKRSIEQQSKAAQYMFNASQPVIDSLSSRYAQFLQGNGDLTQSPVYNAQYDSLKNNAESDYGRARQNIMSSVQPGGALTSALASLDRQKAGQMVSGKSQLMSDLYNQEMSRAFAFGTGQAPVALGALGQSAQIASSMAAAQGQQQSQSAQGLGYAAGQYLGRNNSSTSGSKDNDDTSSIASWFGQGS
jgi:hypothetical protein